MTRRMTGNQGVTHLGVAKEKKTKPRRTPPTNIVLGAVILTMLDELCATESVTRSEMVRTLILRAHEKQTAPEGAANDEQRGGSRRR